MAVEWVLRFRTLGPWRAADVSASDALMIGALLERDSWADLEPTAGPRVCMAFLVQLVARSAGVDLAEAQVAVESLPLPELVGCLSIVGVEPPAAEAVGEPSFV
jgi:hypothetical protein